MHVQERATQILEKKDKRMNSIESLSADQLIELCSIIEEKLKETDKDEDHVFYRLSTTELRELILKIRDIYRKIGDDHLSDAQAQYKLADAVAMSQPLEDFLYGTKYPMHQAIRKASESTTTQKAPTITQEGSNTTVFMPGTCTMEQLLELFPSAFQVTGNIDMHVKGDFVAGNSVGGNIYVDGKKIDPTSGPSFTGLRVKIETVNGRLIATISWTDTASGKRETRTVTE